MRRAAALLSTVLCAATACATSHAGTGNVAGSGGGRMESSVTARPVPPVVLATRSMIPMATLDIDPSLSLYDVVSRYWPQTLRPALFQTSSPDPRGDVVGVYIGGNFAGGPDALRSIRASAVQSLQRLTRSEEYVKWGIGHPGGAILVTFR